MAQKRPQDMDLSEKTAYFDEQLAVKDSEILALQQKNAELTKERDTLLTKLVEKTTITQQEADDIKASGVQ